jgi:hypothetical protein
MILRLIGPEVEYRYDWYHDDDPPAVLFSSYQNKVWVRGASSNGDNHMYFEQRGWSPILRRDLIPIPVKPKTDE